MSILRDDSEIRDLARITQQQLIASRARDYWDGVEDVLNWLAGAEVPAIDAHMLALHQREKQS